MFLLLSEVLEFLDSSATSQNFVEGEKVVNAGHLTYCGILNDDNSQYELLSYCVQSSDPRGTPHEITSKIDKSGKIISAKCTCTSGLSERCKHVAGVLIFCNRNDIKQLKSVSCTDRKCLWNTPRNSCLEQYVPKPLKDHECFEIDNNHSELSDDIKKTIRGKIFSKKLKSILSEHAYEIE